MYVLDASALLALLYREPGSDDIESRLDGSLLSTVNLTEVLQKASAAGLDPDEILGLIRAMVSIVPFDDAMALEAARLWRTTKSLGLSLADRACLALTVQSNGIAVTTDRDWAQLTLPGVRVHVVQR